MRRFRQLTALDRAEIIDLLSHKASQLEDNVQIVKTLRTILNGFESGHPGLRLMAVAAVMASDFVSKDLLDEDGMPLETLEWLKQEKAANDIPAAHPLIRLSAVT